MDADGLVVFHDGLSKGRVFEELAVHRPVPEVADGAVLSSENDKLTVTLKSGLSYVFERPDGEFKEILIQRIQDPSGNYLAFEREKENLTAIKDNCGRVIDVQCTQGRIQSMRLQVPDAPPRLLVKYGYDAAGDLTAVYNPLDKAHRYHYDNHCLVKQTYRSGLSFYC